MEVKGNRVVIGKGGVVTAAVDLSTLTSVGSTTAVTTPEVEPATTTEVSNTDDTVEAMDADALEDTLTSLLGNYGSTDYMNYSMRLFGIPHQFTQYCDYRTYSVSGKSKDALIGRKFIENIMMEAPVVTIIPGKPSYLPAAKDKQATSTLLMQTATESISGLMAAMTLEDQQNLNEKLRYYDFEQDYYTYMSYVNILCATAAAYLELGDSNIDGSTAFTDYHWQNYRWTASSYKMAVSNILGAASSSAQNFVDKLSALGNAVVDGVKNIASTGSATDSGTSGLLGQFTDMNEDDKTILKEVESLFTQMNFVQFYVKADGAVSESASNRTEASKLESMFTSGQEMLKEVAFIANSGGLDATEVQSWLDNAADALNDTLFSSSTGAISGVLSRLMSAGSNVIKGDNMVFPEIYQSSEYTKSYPVTIDLRCPYGNRYSYYLNILVPLFHILALAIPKQTTANTYGSPFLVKAYMPGWFSCNLGIVDSIQIDKNPDGDAFTVDGFPTRIQVTVNIKDLYSDLAITPSGDITLFVANSSLIEYIATCCGINLVTPQLTNRLTAIITSIKQTVSNLGEDIAADVFSGIEGLISSFTNI
jgi:hypothetical protein